MNIQCLFKRSLTGAALLLASSAVWGTTCEFLPDNPSGDNPLMTTMPLQGSTISVGRDLPDGATLFRQTFIASPRMRIRCAASVSTIREEYRLESTPLPQIPPGRPEFQGKIYETGVPGVGVAVWYAGNGFPFSRSLGNCGGGTAACHWGISGIMDISLIKTGPIAGGVIRGDLLPSISMHWLTGNDLELHRIKFSGTVNVVTATCATPDVNVPLGLHRVNDLKGIDTGTPWRDFEIRLDGCPAVSGYSNGTNPTIWYSDGSSTAGTRTGHAVSYQLNPQAGSIDAARGIARLSASTSGRAPAAGGIGVQIADRANQPVRLASLNAGPNMHVGTAAGTSYSIRLRARYIQVADTVTPGPANAAVEFMLQYH